MAPFKPNNLTFAFGRNNRRQDTSANELRKIDSVPKLKMDTDGFYQLDENHQQDESTLNSKSGYKKFLGSVRQLWQHPKGLRKQQSDEDSVKIAFSVIKHQEHEKRLANEVKEAQAHADELEDTLDNERQRFQQTLEAQRSDYKQREKLLKQQLESVQSQMVVVDAWLRVAQEDTRDIILSEAINLELSAEDEIDPSE
ncbi:hypothetical protein VTN00DRAFT_7081 [Thermoascus crustaceus]|uniref:uncharacterized protein n=1 Tax=Thermoascus crustaceus TaxID=5088 RepID=UPI00374258B0